MLEKSSYRSINANHAVVISQAAKPGAWFEAGNAVLAPLYRKRPLLLPEHELLHAWTLYNKNLGTAGWEVPPEAIATLHYEVRIYSRSPSGWVLTIPKELRDKRWLPKAGDVVMLEFDEAEMNFWTQQAYDIQSLREADAS